MQHFPEIQLTFQEARVLGCLLEKEILTPDSYPLTPNSLLLACNQTTSRDPVTCFTGDEVAEALRGLSGKYLVEKNLGGRTPKFEHCIQDVLSMQRSERAVLTVLLLRGPQSAGEIRQRTDRLHTFSSLEDVEETLTWFIDYPHGPLVRRIPVGEGRRVETFVHLLSPAAADGSSGTVTPSAAADTPAENDWRAAIEARLASLEAEIAELKAGHAPRSDDGNP
ncbi:YceH family protein [Luteolibacter arcticus]|uniref:YceH family protein n=1 Tax=Luteolibacter arcticus TaxID=1581411 RepID=A0ABT3GKI5_9BACT|nr:YceH family protein [Luteolibacter arcticus]MCW1924038.1 YceH family protein [Luteolibacter arcticus]